MVAIAAAIPAVLKVAGSIASGALTALSTGLLVHDALSQPTTPVASDTVQPGESHAAKALREQLIAQQVAQVHQPVPSQGFGPIVQSQPLTYYVSPDYGVTVQVPTNITRYY